MPQPAEVGVPVIRRDASGPFRAALLFRAGLRFATFRTLPVPHLVEHLVMSVVPRSPLDYNAYVDDEVMVFHASGQRGEVLDLIRLVARAIWDPPLQRLAREARVVSLEGGSPVPPPSAAALATRYGFQGAGLAGVEGPGPDQMTVEHVTEFIRRCLTRENAVLLTTGELPEDWSVDLPPGPKPDVPVPAVSNVTTPSLLRGDNEGVTLSFELSAEDAPGGVVLLGVLQAAVEDDLRHTRGMVYEVLADRRSVSADVWLSVLACTGRPEDTAEIARAMVGALRLLASQGPTDAQLQHERLAYQAYLADPPNALGAMEGEALRLLESGQVPRTPEELLALIASVDADRVKARAREALERVLVEVTDQTPVDLPGLRDCTDDEYPEAPRHTGRTFRRKLLSFAPRDTTVTIGDDGLTLHMDGYANSMRWSDVVAVERDGDLRAVFGADGRVVPVVAELFRESGELLRLIDQRCAAVVYDAVAT